MAIGMNVYQMVTL